jgi:tripartite ATP-independent transporter DctM subunit
MSPFLVTILLFGLILVGIALGIPIAFVLSGIGVIFTFILWDVQGLSMISSFLFTEGTSYILISLPLFVLMANFLEVSGLADELYEAIYIWTAKIPGGLASGTVVICAIFAAMSGISGVATVSMGLIAMLKRGYNKKLVVGTVGAGGALGILIPPSVIAIIYGSVTDVSIGQLFMGGVIPGIILAGVFIAYISIRCFLQPHMGPPINEVFSWRERFLCLKSLVFPTAIIALVLGTIYTGVVTPTESAAMGASGSLVCCILLGKFTLEKMKKALLRTMNLTVMVMWIIFGATCFSSIYTVGGASQFMLNAISGWGISPMGIVWIMMIIYLILGCFIDPAGIVLITVPIFVPIIVAAGLDPMWFGILFILSSEMAYLTPPFGFNLFYLRAVVPKEVTMADIYGSILPFVCCQFAVMVLVMYVPQLALWLPGTMISAR